MSVSMSGKETETARLISRRTVILLITVLFLICGLMASQVYGASADKKTQKTVKVGYYEDNNGFQEGFSDGARKSGYAYEYYQEIAKYAGWDYVYYYGSWSEIYDMLISGKIDIMAGVSKTDEREGQMLFPDNVMGTESYYVFVPTESNTIKSSNISTLNGKTIGVNKKSLMLTLFRKYVRENDLDCTIKTYDGYLSCSKALKDGEIDGLVITDNYVVDGVKPVIKIGDSDIYFAIAKGRTDLLKDINSAQDQIIAASPYYVTYLQSKYFDHSVLRQALNDSELTWLRNKKSLTIGYVNNRLPYSGSDRTTGKSMGVVEELRKDIASFLGITIRTRGYSSGDELIAALKAGKVDAAFPVYGDTWTAEQNGVYLTKEVTSDRMVAIYTGEYKKSLLNKVAVAEDSMGQEPYIAQYYPKAEIEYYKDIRSCIKALKSGSVTSIIIDNNIIQRYLSENTTGQELHIAYLDEPVSFCMAVSEDGTTLQSIINKSIVHIDSARIEDAITRNTYGTASYTLGSFLQHNVLLVITMMALLLILLISIFAVYRKKTRRNQLQLAQASQAKSEFLSRMSHDIRTPMNAIINLTDMARDEIDDKGKLKNDLEKISISSEFLLGLINDILDMSRIESGKLTLSPSVYHFKEFSAYLEGVIRPLCEQKDITFICDEIDDGVDIYIDRIRMNQIFFNILSNAVKYTEPGGTVRLVIVNRSIEDNVVRCEYVITDTGCGMSEEFLEHVYQPFERADNTEAYTGTGLGLTITKAIVDAMGGTIEISSRLGEGTRVTICLDLPLATEEQKKAALEGKRIETGTTANDAADDLRGRRILVAEDSPLNLEILQRILEARGIQSDGVENGALCVEKFRSSSEFYYSAILMDIRMPVMDGLKAAANIRAMERGDAGNIPIIALTANALTDDEMASREAGMNAHLAKPINPDILFETLRKQIVR
jgi:signal transduction histidine kinase/ActR/RegA family two-component response regulator